MKHIRGFPPLAGREARVLVLGSMPGLESLARQQYYAHPRNAFWPIMVALFGLTRIEYGPRAEELITRGVAVWDVLRACIRPGSLDAAIDESSIRTNDFGAFFQRHPGIRHVYFNGAKAESVYLKHVLPGLDEQAAGISRQRLPSTSPAHAAMTLEQKTVAWRVLADSLDQEIETEP